MTTPVVPAPRPLAERLREPCLSRWSDTITDCNEQRAEAADALDAYERLEAACRWVMPGSARSMKPEEVISALRSLDDLRRSQR